MPMCINNHTDTVFAVSAANIDRKQGLYVCTQVYLGGIEPQALDGLQKGLDGVIAGSKH